jgi:hypothetical protein
MRKRWLVGVICITLLTKLIGSRFRVQVCPPRPETETGSGGATGCGYAIVFSVYDFLAFHHRILTCQPALVSGS